MNDEEIIKAVISATRADVSPDTDNLVLEAARKKTGEMKSLETPRATKPLHARPVIKALTVAAAVLVVFGVTLIAAPEMMKWVVDSYRAYHTEPGGKPVSENENVVRRHGKGCAGGPSGTYTGRTTPPNDEPYEAVLFKYYPDNPFVYTDDENVSSFAADADTGSYAVTRRFINDGYIPSPKAVRTEEFVNYFEYDYAAPSRGTFALHVEGAPSKFALYKDRGYQLLRIGIRAKDIPAEHRRDANITIAVDVSSSMAIGDRIRQVRKTLRTLLDELRPTDRVAVVAFSGNAYTALPPTFVKHGGDIIGAVEMLTPDNSTDSTNIEAGLTHAYEIAAVMFDDDKINRVILCSDGVANVGRTGPESILEVIQQYPARRTGPARIVEPAQGIYLTTVGFGMGNYNDYLMEQLADRADGQYFHIDTNEESGRVFCENLTRTLQVTARDVKINVDFNPKVVSRFRLIGYENRRITVEDSDGSDGGEIGAGGMMTVLYEIKFHEDAKARRVAALTINYTNPDTGKAGRTSRDINRKEFGKSFDKASAVFRLAAGAAEFAGILRENRWSEGNTFADVLAVIREVLEDREGDADVMELRSLIEKAQRHKQQ